MASLRQELNEALSRVWSADNQLEATQAELEACRQECMDAVRQRNRLRDALKWYANCDICAKAVCEGSYCRMEHDDGDRARFALQDRAAADQNTATQSEPAEELYESVANSVEARAEALNKIILQINKLAPIVQRLGQIISPEPETQKCTVSWDKLHCIFGCRQPVVGIYHIEGGLAAKPDQLQALCQQHKISAEEIGQVDAIVERLIP